MTESGTVYRVFHIREDDALLPAVVKPYQIYVPYEVNTPVIPGSKFFAFQELRWLRVFLALASIRHPYAVWACHATEIEPAGAVYYYPRNADRSVLESWWAHGSRVWTPEDAPHGSVLCATLTPLRELREEERFG